MMRAPPVTIETLQDHPRRYDRQTVRVTGEVERVLTDRAFIIEGLSLFGADELPVITRAPVRFAGIPLAAEHRVVVTGTAFGSGAEVDLERELGGPVPAEVLRVIGDGPVLVAREVWRTGEASGWSNLDTTLPPSEQR